MTTYHGNSGVIKVGSDAVAEVTKFSLDENQPVTPDTAMGDAAETHLVGAPYSWSGSLDAHYFPADTGQAALARGASVNLELDAIGVGSGLEKITGTATVSKVSIDVDMGNIVSVSIQFTGNGPITHGTQSS